MWYLFLSVVIIGNVTVYKQKNTQSVKLPFVLLDQKLRAALEVPGHPRTKTTISEYS